MTCWFVLVPNNIVAGATVHVLQSMWLQDNEYSSMVNNEYAYILYSYAQSLVKISCNLAIDYGWSLIFPNFLGKFSICGLRWYGITRWSIILMRNLCCHPFIQTFRVKYFIWVILFNQDILTEAFGISISGQEKSWKKKICVYSINRVLTQKWRNIIVNFSYSKIWDEIA